MQRLNPTQDPLAVQLSDAPSGQGKDPYVPPVIPMGLPHVVQYVTGSILHMPGPFQLMADRMSRYANANGEVSIALEFLCKISDLGSKNTAKGYIDKLTAMDMLETVHGQGGNERKSNTYRFLGGKRNWQPMPGEEPGTDPWLTLLEVRLENEGLKQQVRDLTARVELLTNSGTVGHLDVTYGDGPEEPDSYETANHQRDLVSIDHSGVTDGDDQEGPDSYETAISQRDIGAIGHSRVTDGSSPTASETASHSYENPDSDSSPRENVSIGQYGVTNGPTEGQEYLERRARVEALVMEFRDHYARSFRGGVSSAVHHFSLNPDNERDLLLQVETLRADREATASRPNAPAETEDPAPSGRREVEPCPDCDRPFTTHGGAEYCPECTERRRRGGG